MNGKIVGVTLLIIAAAAGAAMYYLQVYGFYERVAAQDLSLRMTTLASDAPEEILADNVQGIDASSSPLRFRACFTTPMTQALLSETYVIYDNAEPLVGPGWFDCFDAGEIDAALNEGRAVAYLGEHEIHRGVDRVIAVFDDGRAFAWHQLNGSLE